jgi:hypothetical protein
MSEHQPLTARQLVATLVAHRGYQKLYPENTALSVTQAIKAGALFVEIDIQLSKDHQPGESQRLPWLGSRFNTS